MLTALIVVVIVVLLLGVAVGTRPNTYRVERSVTIATPPDVPFGYVNDFHKWSLWSPFEKLDPNLVRTFTGSPAGVGANYGWSGNSKAGQGTMAITESMPGQRVAVDLHFVKPFESTSLTEFTFKPVTGGTSVTWAMSGNNTLMGKAISLVSSMDSLMGKSFEEGLANLKSVSETRA